jgi:hypothetical protein
VNLLFKGDKMRTGNPKKEKANIPFQNESFSTQKISIQKKFISKV